MADMTTIAHGMAARHRWAPLFLYGVSPDGRICACRKGINCPSKGKHPIEEEWASKPFPSGPDIQAMGESHPTANLGVRTGDISGVFVVDVDSGGLAPWAALVAEHGLGETFIVQTGSGFWHYYFRIPAGVTIGSSRGSLPKGIDVRGNGGQVVFPPSRTDKGEYRIYANVPPTEPPPWLLELILTPVRQGTVVPEGVEKAPTPEGAEKTAAMVQKWTAELRALRETPWREGAGWDETCWRRAQDFAALANSPWSPLTHTDAHRLFMESAPFDAAWDERQAKWDRAVVEKAGQMKDPPTPRDGILGMATSPPSPTAPAAPTAPAVASRPLEEGEVAGADDRLETDSKVIAEFCNESLRGNAHYSPLYGWHVWNGKIWAEVEIQVIEERFRLWVRGKIDEAVRANDTDKVKFYVKYLSGSRATAPVARTRGAMTIPGEVEPPFDKHPDLLTVGNGIVDLRTGVLLPFSSHYMMTRMTPVDYVPGATHPDWEASLSALPDDVRSWMQIRLGQAITGYPAWDDLVIFCHGSGSNGKTNLMAGVTKALRGHAAFLSEQVLSAGSNEHTTYMTDLRGARLALLEETPEGMPLNTKRLKDIAGSPVIKARKMRQDNVDWPATHALFVTTNHAPQVRATDHGTWRRLALVDFPYRYVADPDLAQPGDRVGDQALRARLEHSPNGQHEAILAWLIAGARMWYEQGGLESKIPLPERVRKDSQEWKDGSDRIGGWIRERMVPDPTACISSQEAFADFTAYLRSQGAREWAENTFAERLKISDHARELGLDKRRIIYKGLATNLSRRGGPAYQDYEVGQKVTVWTGMRFQSPTEETSNVVDMATRR